MTVSGLSLRAQSLTSDLRIKVVGRLSTVSDFREEDKKKWEERGGGDNTVDTCPLSSIQSA